MTAEHDQNKSCGDMLRQVLLDYLRASRVVGWPGADGLTDDDIVNCYPQAISAGDAPGWDELQSRFPELADALHALRSAKGWLDIPWKRDGHQKNTSCEDVRCRLSRWLVSFATESGWYPVGEFLALDAAAAIERAVEVLGTGTAHKAEEIPWDAAPLSRGNVR